MNITATRLRRVHKADDVMNGVFPGWNTAINGGRELLSLHCSEETGGQEIEARSPSATKLLCHAPYLSSAVYGLALFPSCPKTLHTS